MTPDGTTIEGLCPFHPDLQLREKGRLGSETTVREFCPRCEDIHQRSLHSLETQGTFTLSLQSSEDAPRPSTEVSLPPLFDGQEPQQTNSK
jgi:hypothetical protein